MLASKMSTSSFEATVDQLCAEDGGSLLSVLCARPIMKKCTISTEGYKAFTLSRNGEKSAQMADVPFSFDAEIVPKHMCFVVPPTWIIHT